MHFEISEISINLRCRDKKIERDVKFSLSLKYQELKDLDYEQY